MPNDEYRYDRTETMPNDWSGDGGYVRDTDEWIARCLARVTALDPVVQPDEARAVVAQLSTLERWRILAPETAAEQLYEKPPGPSTPAR